MVMDKINLKITKHAKIKILQRGINKNNIIKVIKNPDIKAVDTFDDSLLHYIKDFNGNFLRVIGRWLDKNVFLVITVFYDRRFKRSKGK